MRGNFCGQAFNSIASVILICGFGSAQANNQFSYGAAMLLYIQIIFLKGIVMFL